MLSPFSLDWYFLWPKLWPKPPYRWVASKAGFPSGFHWLMGHGKSHLSRVRRVSRPAPGNDPGGGAQHHLSHLCATNMGGGSRSQGYRLLKKAWQQIKNDIDESGIDRQELLSWSIQTLMAAGSWAGDATEEPRRCGGLHSPA